ADPKTLLRARAPMSTESPTPQPQTPPAQKSLFDKVLTATPVILTIVATFLVGQSSSEMTQAQYHRASASQNQSKVADQWAFFQAKRIRGTSHEVTAELLSALKDTEVFTRDTLPAAADGLAREMAAAEKIGSTFAEALGKDKDQTAARKVTDQ